MRITNVEADIVRIPLSTRFSGSVYQIESRCTVVVRVHTDEGLVSEIYSGDERTGYQLLKDLVVGPMAEAVKGEDPMAIERCWQKMFALTPHVGDKAIAMRAIAAIDIALWDIAGKALGVPVRTLLGGYADRAPVVRFAYYVQGRDTAFMVEDLLHQRERGIGGVKLKVGGVSVADDLLRVRAIRDTLGEDFIIVCDANQAWTLDEALEFAGPAREMGLEWLEEPCRWQNADNDMRQVRLRTGIPVAAGQGESSSWGGQRLMDTEAVDILNIDAAICGGISEWRRVAGAAQMRGVRMAHHRGTATGGAVAAGPCARPLCRSVRGGARPRVLPTQQRPAGVEQRRNHRARRAGHGPPPRRGSAGGIQDILGGEETRRRRAWELSALTCGSEIYSLKPVQPFPHWLTRARLRAYPNNPAARRVMRAQAK